MNKLSRLFLVCGILLLYFSSISGEFAMAILGAGFLGMWFGYNPK